KLLDATHFLSLFFQLNLKAVLDSRLISIDDQAIWNVFYANGCNSGYFAKKALFKTLTVVIVVICLNLSKMSRFSVK
ncbi:hypothetical protein ABEO75_02475, partial [Paenibacillus macerans]|nr:hypothetical protein [Paenibacillus macerans]